jgi:hypothetical protein
MKSSSPYDDCLKAKADLRFPSPSEERINLRGNNDEQEEFRVYCLRVHKVDHI